MNTTSTQNSNQAENHQSVHDDEIDLGKILKNIWFLRWKITLFFLLFFSLGGVFLGVDYYNKQQAASYSYVIELENIIDEKYANGTTFSLSHLLLPQILKKTIQELNLQHIEYEQIKSSIQLVYYNPNTLLLQQQFDKLSNSKKNVAQLQQLQAAINEQLNNKNSIQITFSGGDIPASLKKNLSY